MIGRAISFYLLCLLCAASANAEPAETQIPGSLFFTPTESGKIDALLQKNPAVDYSSAIHLGAVIYYDADDWVIWLQGKRWTPESDEPNLHIADVKPNEVRLIWIDNPGAPPLDITLHPYQTYHLASGVISTGEK